MSGAFHWITVAGTLAARLIFSAFALGWIGGLYGISTFVRGLQGRGRKRLAMLGGAVALWALAIVLTSLAWQDFRL